MGEVNQNLKSLADDVVALFPANTRHQAHATRIVFIAWMVETLRVRKTMTVIRCLHGYLLLNKVDLLSIRQQRQRHNQRGILNRNAGVVPGGPVVADPRHTGIVLNFLLYLK
jgi:hypothetical protein